MLKKNLILIKFTCTASLFWGKIGLKSCSLYFLETHLHLTKGKHEWSPIFLAQVDPLIRLMTAWLLSQIALHIRWSKYWSCSFSTSPFNEYSGLIDWFNCLAVQGTLKSLHQHHNLKASSFSAQLFLWPSSHIQIWLLRKPVLTLQILVSKVIPPLVNILATFVIAFLPRSKCLFISWLQSPSTVILKPKKIKSLSLLPLCSFLLAMKWWAGYHDIILFNVDIQTNFFILLFHPHQEVL